MSDVFLATGTSGHVNYETGEVDPLLCDEVEGILWSLRNVGKFTVFCGIEDDNYKISEKPKAQVVKKDLARISQAQILVAYFHDDIKSEGLNAELGYALGLEKQIFLATNAINDVELGYFNQGLVEAGKAVHIAFDSPTSLANMILRHAKSYQS